MSREWLDQLKVAVGAQSVKETHISWVLLTEAFAYKVKKPVKNEFLDYSTLERRRHCCEQELRLDRRTAPELYLGIVYFVDSATQPGCLELDESRSNQQPVREVGVKMHRFPAEALLSERLCGDAVREADLVAFARSLADFHASATRMTVGAQGTFPYANAQAIYRDACDNLRALQGVLGDGRQQEFEQWTEGTFTELKGIFAERQQDGFVRECHGDLHAGNIVYWRKRLTPFDGIEFNEHFRWIDVLSDTGFLAMDLFARGHSQLAHVFVSQYIEASGDYHHLRLLRWYMVYRALVRAKVSEMAAQQHLAASEAARQAVQERDEHIHIAQKLMKPVRPHLWITHGLSGSGKSSAAVRIVRRHGALRIRSDVERKRLRGLSPTFRPDASQATSLYSPAMHEQTYNRLEQLTREILKAGLSVVVDAAFLNRAQRQAFRDLADQCGAPFHIIACEAPVEELRRRLRERWQQGTDASDAGVEVMEAQLSHFEVLGEDERLFLDEQASDRDSTPSRPAVTRGHR